MSQQRIDNDPRRQCRENYINRHFPRRNLEHVDIASFDRHTNEDDSGGGTLASPSREGALQEQEVQLVPFIVKKSLSPIMSMKAYLFAEFSCQE
jgi:hypothetical protein